MRVNVLLRSMQALVIALSLVHASAARATPDFPAVVVRALELPGITIDPPQGCELCHTSDSGGTSLRPFGTVVQQYGAQPYQENTLEAALGQIAQNEPQLVADIKASKDPNTDTGPTNVHTPEYGCGASPGRAELPGWPACLGVIVAVGLRRSRARRRLRLRRSATG